MIGSRFHAACRAFRDPAIVRHPEALKTEAFELVAATMDRAINASRYQDAGGADDWSVGVSGAHAIIRSNLIALKGKLLMEMAYPKEDQP